MDKTYRISLMEINPYIRRSAINHIESGFSSGRRQIYHYQIQYIYDGYGEIEIDGVLYPAKKGDLFFWGPSVQHLISSSTYHPFAIIGVQFDFTRNHAHKEYACGVPKPFIPDEINEIVEFTDFEGFPNNITINNLAQAEHTLLEIAHEYQTQKIYSQERASSLFKAFLLSIAREVTLNLEKNDSNSYTVDTIIEYIHSNLHKKLTNNEIAARFNFHPNYLSRLINTYTGMSLHRYIINTRLNKAVELLGNSNFTIGQVSEAVGFENIHHFSQLFKKKMGCSPSVMR